MTSTVGNRDSIKILIACQIMVTKILNNLRVPPPWLSLTAGGHSMISPELANQSQSTGMLPCQPHAGFRAVAGDSVISLGDPSRV